MRPALALFLKAPRIGTVKTRLATEVGDRRALRLYRVLVSRTIAAVREAGLDVIIWFTPGDAASEMRFWLGDWDFRPQASGDLGARLAASARAIEPGRGWIAVGADCPRLGVDHLREASTLVERGELVIGPAEDGGYYLIGGPTPLPDLFSDMPWSTSRLLEETRSRLKRIGVRWHELPLLRDVDTAEDARAEGLLT
ncbi:MAG TPA: TIGR04282 family arsenosugar biosynthesis glycosyltransferase [Gemmatimonadales bacterium]|jgi:rSAM/selenodomain-associated transferase 1